MIAYFFPPLGGGGVQRTVKFVKYLRDFGYEPTVVTVKKGKHSVDDESFARDIPSDIRVIRTNFIGLFAPKKKKHKEAAELKHETEKNVAKKSFLRKALVETFHFVEKFFFIPDIQMLWRPFANRAVLKLLKKESFDVLYSTSSPFTNHLIARDVHRITGIPWVADFRDHWTLAPSYKPVSLAHKWIDAYFENSILHEANGVIFNTETNRKNIQDSFGFLPKFSEVIYNGFDPDDFSKDISFKKSEFIEARYIGSYYGKQYSAKEVIPALNVALKSLPRLRVTFIGDIDSYSREIIAASPYFNKYIFLKGYVPHSEITKYTQEATFLIVTLPNIPGVECWVPQKMYEYVGSGRPVFALAPENGEIAQILQKVHGGIAISQAKKSEEIAASLQSFVLDLERNDFVSQTNMKAAEFLERKNQTKQLSEFLTKVAHES